MKNYIKIFVVITAALIVVYSVAGCCGAPSNVHEASDNLAPYPAPAASAVPEYEAPSLDGCQKGETIIPAETYDTSAEEYGQFVENDFRSPGDDPLSTFSIDVDTASYSNIRRYLEDGMLPPEDAVRVEECINYFPYDYAVPKGIDPINVGVTISDCPWNEGRYLARISLKAKELKPGKAPVSNLVFLLDVSGSMESPDKLPLVKYAMGKLTDNLSASDRISIVVYAGASGVVLEGCSGENKNDIIRAIDRLYAGGSTAGGAGIELAYRIAEEYYLEGGNNRVILCTDGDFNVGLSSTEELEDLIKEKSKSGVFLSVMGFGTGNIKDNKMETLADKGNGNYAYIDSESEARKVFEKELTSTLYTVAKDVKVQVEFNPDAVKEYRLIGYDNRMLNTEDFNDDKKDAGEMGAGHCVTAFYEIILIGSPENSDDIDDFVFQDNDPSEVREPSGDWLYVKLRYKHPESDESKLMTVFAGSKNYTANPDDDFRFASAVTEFALLLKGSEFARDASYERLIGRAIASRGRDKDGYRNEFIELAQRAAQLNEWNW
jgi:Ca-activated chloride channel family protein